MTAQATGSVRYLACGLRVDSDIALPGALPDPAGADGDVPADVVVRRGGAQMPPGARMLEGLWAIPSPDLALMAAPLWRLRVQGGREVRVDAAPGASAAQLGLAVGYSALMAVLHQRGACPLHASAAAGPGGAVLLLGRPGAGKSTFAAMLSARGFACAGDDLVALDLTGEGPPRVHRGLATAKLFADSRAAMGAGAHEVAAAGDGLGKAVMALPEPAGLRWPVPLRAIFDLDWLHPDDAAPECAPLSPLQALPRLRDAVNHPEFAAPLGLARRYFALLARIAATVPCHALRRPRRPAAAVAACDLVAAHLAPS